MNSVHRELSESVRVAEGRVADEAGVNRGVSDPNKACVISISGGLGNQMLQYAAARAYSIHHGCSLFLDLKFYSSRRHRSFELDAFPIQAEKWVKPSLISEFVNKLRGGSESIPVYQEQSKRFDPQFFETSPPLKLRGYFFSEKYFSPYADQIRSELTPPVARDQPAREMARRLSENMSTSLHVRRGDYVSNPNARQRFWSCTSEYFEAAIEMLPADSTVFVFSDDIEWAKQNIRSSRKTVFVNDELKRAGSPETGLRDLWLMTHAKSHVIANSSFSWWGAWLSGSEANLTIAPKKWFNDPQVDDSDIIPSTWLRI
ncbi:alpha-1,2-fucosyltransferase [Rhodopirellula sp. JC740]|uniref:Alpha-1,2-fucosyltransferase n=1 Tax=Rhodopirellula halodulae TaxID=2894198 RepID=A0ABS8NJJ6_9BACT|nr:alpha-1,2-fucosyltransferase [Rhodopirellula sp. JC740]MCC9643730.1 alpha-1,2-fucosyltransferase [Rhodopirellula sp. JC740]